MCFFAWELYNGKTGGVSLALHDAALAMVLVDLIYMLAATIRFRYWKELFWGLAGGGLLLFIFHKVFLGGISVKLGLLTFYHTTLDYLDKTVK